MKITQLHAVAVRIPQKPPIAPYQSRYRAGSVKDAILVRLETDQGHAGNRVPVPPAARGPAQAPAPQ